VETLLAKKQNGGRFRGVRPNLVHSTQKSTEIKPEIKKSREKLVNFKTSLLLSPQSYMTAVTHRNQEIGLEIRKSGQKSR
jgi:hypothetical protein